MKEFPKRVVGFATHAIGIVGPFQRPGVRRQGKLLEDEAGVLFLSEQLVDCRLRLFAVGTLEITEFKYCHWGLGRSQRESVHAFKQRVPSGGERMRPKRNDLANDRMLAIGHEMRLSSQWGGVKRIIDRGTIGTPQYVLVELSRKPYRPGAGASRQGSTFGMVGSNGSGAYADIDADVAVAVMRNRFDATDMTTLAQIDRIVLDELS